MTKHLTKPIRAIHFMVLALLMTLSSPLVAQDFQKGLAAAAAGDFVTALKEWKPLALAGDTNAQYNLGLMYNNGDGVPQDYKEAVKWYRLAAEQGYAKAQPIWVQFITKAKVLRKTTTKLLSGGD